MTGEHASARRPPLSAAPTAAPPRISVVEWLLAVGHAVASRLKGAPRSAMARLHPPD